MCSFQIHFLVPKSGIFFGKMGISEKLDKDSHKSCFKWFNMFENNDLILIVTYIASVKTKAGETVCAGAGVDIMPKDRILGPPPKKTKKKQSPPPPLFLGPHPIFGPPMAFGALKSTLPPLLNAKLFRFGPLWNDFSDFLLFFFFIFYFFCKKNIFLVVRRIVGPPKSQFLATFGPQGGGGIAFYPPLHCGYCQ